MVWRFIGRHRIIVWGLCAVAGGIVVLTAVYASFGHLWIEDAYRGRAPLGLSRLIVDRGRPLESYLDYGDEIVGRLRGYLFAFLAIWILLLLYALAGEIRGRRLRIWAVQVAGVLAALTCVELFLRYAMPVKIGELTYENFRASANPKIVLEPRPLAGEFNADGLRDREYSLEKPDNAFRILVIGDSLAYGYRVALEESYAKKLEKLLNEASGGRRKYEVINMGVPGYRTVQIVERFKEKGLRYDPDMVIYGYWLDDITYSGFTPFLMSPSRVATSETVQGMMTANPLERAVKKLLLSSQIVRRAIFIMRERRARTAGGGEEGIPSAAEGGGLDPELEALYGEFISAMSSGRYRDAPGFEPYYADYADRGDFLAWSDALEELSRVCVARGISCLLLVTPVLYDCEAGDYDWAGLHAFIGEVAARHSIPTLDLQKEFSKYSAAQMRAGDVEHPNERGHELIARELFGWLNENEPAVKEGGEPG